MPRREVKRPTSRLVQTGAAVGFGGPVPTPGTGGISFRIFRNRTLRGLANVQLRGLIIHGCAVHESSGGHRWATLPTRPILDDLGQIKRDAQGRSTFRPVVEFADPALAEQFSRMVVDAVQRHWPAAFRPDKDAMPEPPPANRGPL